MTEEFYVNMSSKPTFVKPEILVDKPLLPALHTVNPRSIKGEDWWYEQRTIAYRRNNDCCWVCGVNKVDAKHHQWLEAHETYLYDYNKFRVVLNQITALCHSCHQFIHRGRLEAMVRKGRVPREKLEDILEHGRIMIAKYDLRAFKQHPLSVTLPSAVRRDWNKWHLRFEGRDYHSPFKNPGAQGLYYAGITEVGGEPTREEWETDE